MILKLIAVIVIAYLAGSVNFAILMFKLLGKEDPRTMFSGNPGTVNVYRQAGIPWAALVLLLDMGRAVGVAALAYYFIPAEYLSIVAFFLVLGNRYPCFHGFTGGKGVANYLGFTAFLSPLTAGISCLVWITIYGIVRITFIPSFLMVLTLGAGSVYAVSRDPVFIAGAAVTVFFVMVNHRKNVVELIQKQSNP